MQVRETFAREGYVIFYDAVTEDTIDEWRASARQTQTEAWFTDVVHDLPENGDPVEDHDLINDEGRVKAVIPDQLARRLSRMLARFYRTFSPAADANDREYQKTPAGSNDLPARREFAAVPVGTNIMDTSTLPGSIFVATDNNTSFYTYGWNHNIVLRSNRRQIEVNKGDILLISSLRRSATTPTTSVFTLAFVGTSSRSSHHPQLVRVIDDTRRITDDPFCLVWNCTFKGNAVSIRRHVIRFHGIRFRRMVRRAP
ncbi:hypothetical protein PF005_g25767 [Phytophthora fragariae]|uniref:Uncharacterized protein n=2 Tax=Phytophthora fragariae TaxID=53985 RepID=A0A6A3W118_9STRA|nr:hypothetical protein PF009_g24713 [Phytophthora fragariae]KAE9088084.1 hypothetical protein PF010_g19494 [Phytophthora fragariae]KAE9104492.1 hypothetical protein PF007_g14037 [Phytophthora fragariae]KAE9110392.1 hypothetical protein PF006_g20461 [Phytophthora fragariae]KAE9174653.1 hypothetical protein PF005_g25767 [Phytophthora fragariae]